MNNKIMTKAEEDQAVYRILRDNNFLTEKVARQKVRHWARVKPLIEETFKNG